MRPGTQTVPRATGSLSNTKSDVQITNTELEYWQTFFLTAYRDGSTAVDHIDMDLESASSELVTLTLAVTSISATLTEAEAKKRLGL